MKLEWKQELQMGEVIKHLVWLSQYYVEAFFWNIRFLLPNSAAGVLVCDSWSQA